MLQSTIFSVSRKAAENAKIFEFQKDSETPIPCFFLYALFASLRETLYFRLMFN